MYAAWVFIPREVVHGARVITSCCHPCHSCMQEVNLARDIHVHFFRGGPGSTRDDGATDCIRLLHLVDLYKVRHHSSPAPLHSINTGDSAWWWPVARVQEHGQQLRQFRQQLRHHRRSLRNSRRIQIR